VGVGDGRLTQLPRIPFNLSLGLAMLAERRERKRMVMTKEVDEETPLLDDR
jgi:hypothetical protein